MELAPAYPVNKSQGFFVFWFFFFFLKELEETNTEELNAVIS